MKQLLFSLIILLSNYSISAEVGGSSTANIGTSGALALDASVTGMSAKLPAALGAATNAASLSVAPSSNGNWLSDGTTGGNVISGDSGQNAIVVTGSRKEVSFTTASVQAVASTDVSNYRLASVQVTGQGGSSTITFQQSNDNSTWASAIAYLSTSGAGGTTTTSTTTGMWVIPLQSRYFRLNVTGIVSGTTVGLIEFTSNPSSLHQMNITGTIQPGNVANTTAWLVSSQPYTSGMTAVTSSSGNVSNATSSATLAAVSAKTTYISGFEFTSSGATVGTVVTCTVTGTISGTLSYTYAAPAGVLAMGTPLLIPFLPPIPGSATNTAIVASCPALGAGNTNATIVAHGYTL